MPRSKQKKKTTVPRERLLSTANAGEEQGRRSEPYPTKGEFGPLPKTALELKRQLPRRRRTPRPTPVRGNVPDELNRPTPETGDPTINRAETTRGTNPKNRAHQKNSDGGEPSRARDKLGFARSPQQQQKKHRRRSSDGGKSAYPHESNPPKAKAKGQSKPPPPPALTRAPRRARRTNRGNETRRANGRHHPPTTHPRLARLFSAAAGKDGRADKPIGNGGTPREEEEDHRETPGTIRNPQQQQEGGGRERKDDYKSMNIGLSSSDSHCEFCFGSKKR
ncbi:hypothetical protein NL676_039455 [Syzygium grande]|nr:hypothetical protein NL676_039455 [Syzygium grande]